jgi:hypothetical protein
MLSARRAVLFACLLAATAAVTLSGCASISPHRLEDTLAAFHDDLRWGRPEWAERAMAEHLRGDFQTRHSQWAERVRIVDLDVEPARTREGRTYVRAKYTWNFIDEVELRETTVETRWNAGMSDWTCDQERVVAGDPRLFSGSPRRPSASPGTASPGTASPDGASTAAASSATARGAL